MFQDKLLSKVGVVTLILRPGSGEGSPEGKGDAERGVVEREDRGVRERGSKVMLCAESVLL